MKSNKYAFVIMLTLIFVLTCGLSFAKEERYYKTKKYEVTITNLTRGQIFSPPIVVVHDSKFSLFRLGYPASPALAALAEDGDRSLLVDQIRGRYPYVAFDDMDAIPPGESKSVTLKISKRGRLRYISVASMLVISNDAFFAASNIWFHGKRNVNLKASAYDAGSERNSENCDYIPGPPCGSGGVRDTVGSEGYVHVHAGVHGTNPEGDKSDLIPAMHDWNNPVAKITIRRIYH